MSAYPGDSFPSEDPDDPLYRSTEDAVRERAIEATAIAVGVEEGRVVLTLEVGEAFVRWTDGVVASRELAWAIFDATAEASKRGAA